MSTTNITTAMSQISISNLAKKQRKHPVLNDNAANEYINVSDDQPKYLKVPDHIFKQMLLKSSSAEMRSVIELLDTCERFQYVRTYVHLLNDVCYLKLEVDFLDHYSTIATAEGIWSSPLDKGIINNNSLYRINFKTKAQLERHRQLRLNRLQKVENELIKQQQQYEQLFGNNNSVDMNKLSTNLLGFVRQHQYKLVKHFERKEALLQFDANDHRLVKTFYDLKPLEDQVCVLLFF